uniref:Uncharacterized protein n=1 Tax=Steinernema glaseri TaxID=37863 RepID=A0A1I8AJU2_9BILA
MWNALNTKLRPTTPIRRPTRTFAGVLLPLPLDRGHLDSLQRFHCGIQAISRVYELLVPLILYSVHVTSPLRETKIGVIELETTLGFRAHFCFLNKFTLEGPTIRYLRESLATQSQTVRGVTYPTDELDRSSRGSRMTDPGMTLGMSKAAMSLQSSDAVIFGFLSPSMERRSLSSL